jgi:hypothetical protein
MRGWHETKRCKVVRKAFFSEEKNQKTLVSSPAARSSHDVTNKRPLLLFFSTEELAFLYH